MTVPANGEILKAMWLRMLVVVVVGCYSPTAVENAPCPTGNCPSGQRCNSAGVCVPDGTPDEPDAFVMIDAAPDAPPDAPLSLAPQLRGVVAADGLTNMTATATPPNGTMPGDLLVASVNCDGTCTITAPVGWTRVIELDSVEDAFSCAVYYRYAANGADSFAFTFSNNLGYVHLLAFSNVHMTNPIDAFDGDALAATSQPTAPSITTTRARTLLLTIYTLDLSNDTFNPIAGMTEVYDVFTQYLRVSASTAEVATPMATGARVAMRSGADVGPTINFSIALAPK